MVTFQTDIDLDDISDRIDEAWVDALHDGQDITSVFEDWASPLRATVVNAVGPAGGNPLVEFTFKDVSTFFAWAALVGIQPGAAQELLGN